ncbi:DUF1501 domain-containing protein [Zavarzinella formosa]|uniref:DUF1501 domain-containing protein n=1 Tax=Zavarzinella formosa TaxID=360055 RepID=UPI0003140E57|nr:DUF1501 domain-containing protein [Zavarzinella formosa]
MKPNNLSRRDWMSVAAGLGLSMSGWLPKLAAETAADPQRKRSCILLWMNGGPSTIDMWDLKPGHANGGPFKEIATAAPGLKFGEHLPKLARHAKDIAVVRSMSTKEGDHARATYYLRTGNLPQGALQFPSIGSLLSKELGNPASELPNFVSVSPFRFFSQGAFGPGFLGPNHAPLIVGEGNFGAPAAGDASDRLLKVQDLARPKEVSDAQADSRFGLLRDLDSEFGADHPNLTHLSHRSAYDRAVMLMQSVGARAFDLQEESVRVRDAYGRNIFGQGCLLARRLVERGVPFVEVNLGGWDTHQNNFDALQRLNGILDSGWSQLMTDLSVRGLLESTTIVWMGEFGRTPRINQGKGRDHYPNAWSAVLAGGGIKGGQAFGKTTDDGTKVQGDATSVPDLLATLCKALGIDHLKTNNSNVGRPIRIVDKSAKVIKDVVA